MKNLFRQFCLFSCLIFSYSLYGQIQTDTATLDQYTGYYFFPPDNDNVHVTREGEQLYLQPMMQDKFKMQALSHSSFILPQGITITFIVDEQGQVKHAIARRGEQELTLPPVYID